MDRQHILALAVGSHPQTQQDRVWALARRSSGPQEGVLRTHPNTTRLLCSCGSVFHPITGSSTVKKILFREGITSKLPTGTSWTEVVLGWAGLVGGCDLFLFLIKNTMDRLSSPPASKKQTWSTYVFCFFLIRSRSHSHISRTSIPLASTTRSKFRRRASECGSLQPSRCASFPQVCLSLHTSLFLFFVETKHPHPPARLPYGSPVRCGDIHF